MTKSTGVGRGNAAVPAAVAVVCIFVAGWIAKGWV
jgi:hypothetical protein